MIESAKNGLIFNICVIFAIFSMNLLSFSNGDRIKSKIYKSIESKHFCFRRMNATNQIGCNTKENGNVGIVYMINSDKDLIHVLESGQHWPYMAVITPKHFNLETLKRFKQSSDRISGVLVIDFDPKNRTSVMTFLSPEKSCPNELFDLMINDTTYGHCRQQQWNSPKSDSPYSEGLMFEDWPFPIFFIKNQTNINEIKDCFDRFGGPDWPLCAVQLEGPMNAAKDSVTCLRRTAYSKSSYSLSQTLFCDPLGGSNIFSTLLDTSKNDSITNKSIVVLSARLDSFSMFDNISPGADSALTSVVTLLSVADTLTKLKSDLKNKTKGRNVLFALFDGEAFDYIGSSRVLYDMKANMFPVDPSGPIDLAQIRSEHFSHFIELSQLASHHNQETHHLWIHKNIGSQKVSEISRLEDILIKSVDSKTLNISKISRDKPLPPASLQTFLKSDGSIPGVVISNHENEYSNKFYNSFYDDIINVNETHSQSLSKRLTQISKVISKSIYQLLTNQTNHLIQPNETLVDQLLECYLKSPVCDLFRYVAPDITFHSQTMEPLPTYVGVFRAPSLSSTSRAFTYMLLSYLTGEQLSKKSRDECIQLNKQNQSYSFFWMASSTNDNGTCVRSQAIKLDAISPAFINYGTDGIIIDSDLYSSWTESQWKGVSGRMFVMPSGVQQWVTLIIGLIVLILSFFVVYFLDIKSSMLFISNNDINAVPQQTLSVGC